MAIDFNRTFGQTRAQTQTTGRDERPKAQFWLNIGYQAEEPEEDGSFRFISLPAGIALDTQEPFPTNSRNHAFAELRAAQNQLLDDIMKFARTLKPGEEKILGNAGGLQIQIRRVNDDLPTGDVENNRYAKRLAFNEV